MKTFEIISQDGKSHYIAAKSKIEVRNFWIKEKPKKIIERKDISPDSVKVKI